MKKEKHSKPPQGRNFVINILIIICIIVIIFSLYNISSWFIENKKGTDLISNIQSQVTITSEDISVNTKNSLWTKDSYIIPYIEECFSCYGRSNLAQRNNKDIKSNSQKYSNKSVTEGKNSNRALLYEMEYLISGKNTDLDNLKRVTNYILTASAFFSSLDT